MENLKCNECSAKAGCSEKTGYTESQETEEIYKVVLVGNPNVGKSVIFNALSGFYAEVSNYPGTTVDVSRAFIKEGELIDTPGAYSLGTYTEDEAVTLKILGEADFVINVISALSIERDLFLTKQLIDAGLPIVTVVNQTDEADKAGIEINFALLEKMLGVKVIPSVAVRGQGIREIKKSITDKEYKISDKITPSVEKFFTEQNIACRDRVGKLTETESRKSPNPELKDKICTERISSINEIVRNVVSEKEKEVSLAETFGNLLYNPLIGIATAVALLFVLYQILGVFIAGTVVDFLTGTMETYYSPWIRELFSGFTGNHAVTEIFVGEFGLLIMTPTLIFGVLVPLLTGFYLFMAVLEDSGYLPRLAILTDNVLSKLGLNGRAVIPIILGFGCSCMGVMTTRILGSKKERAIATAILGLTIPCSAQLGIIIALLSAAGGFKLWILYVAIILFSLILTGTVLNKLMRGRASDLFIDIPPMRMPRLTNTFNKTFFRIINFLKEAVPLFLAGAFVLSVLKLVGGLEFLRRLFAPIIKNMLHLPETFADAFIMGLIRRDMGAAGILDMADTLSPLQVLISAVVLTLFVPCIAALIVIYKERGIKEASLIWGGSFIFAITAGAILTRVLGFII